MAMISGLASSNGAITGSVCLRVLISELRGSVNSSAAGMNTEATSVSGLSQLPVGKETTDAFWI